MSLNEDQSEMSRSYAAGDESWQRSTRCYKVDRVRKNADVSFTL